MRTRTLEELKRERQAAYFRKVRARVMAWRSANRSSSRAVLAAVRDAEDALERVYSLLEGPDNARS